MTKRLLTEGGLGGHMDHLYDNYDLTFEKMKDIFMAASNGELVGTEKTDGQNLYVSYSLPTGEARAARNKGHIKKGGISASELAQTFAGRGTLETAFNEAFQSFENIVGAFPEEAILQIFGEDANIFYNAEIMDPRNPNVVYYNKPRLLIHQKGHADFDRETGNRLDVDVNQNAAVLKKEVEAAQGNENKEIFSVEINAVKQLQALDDDIAARKAIGDLEREMADVGLSYENTIAEYLTVKIANVVDAALPDIPEENRKELVKRILGVPGASLTVVKRGLSKEQKGMLAGFLPDKFAIAGLKKNAIRPLEMIVHEFSVEMIKTLESAFIADNTAETQRLRDIVHQAVQDIESIEVREEYPEAIAILNKSLEKLKNIENITTASEGFVFDFDGYTYKFTGNFAPMNTILGLFEYGRGAVPPLKMFMAKQRGEVGRVVALFPGGFKPPHAGHYSIAEYLNNLEFVDEVVVIISKKSRTEHSADERIEVDQLMAKAIWEIYTADLAKVNITVTEEASPVGASYKFLAEELNPGDSAVFAVGEKDKEDKRFGSIIKYGADRNINVRTVIAPDINGLSATEMRKCILMQNQAGFTQCLPGHLTESDIEEIWNIVNGTQKTLALENLDFYISDVIKEMSAMAAGAVQGYAGSVDKADDEEPSLIREEDIEEELIEEVFNYLLEAS